MIFFIFLNSNNRSFSLCTAKSIKSHSIRILSVQIDTKSLELVFAISSTTSYCPSLQPCETELFTILGYFRVIPVGKQYFNFWRENATPFHTLYFCLLLKSMKGKGN